MQKITLLLTFILFLANCSTTVVKPAYIDPEMDLYNKLQENYKILKKQADLYTVIDTIEKSYVYTNRINAKITFNNKKATK